MIYKAMTYDVDFNPPIGYKFRGFLAGWLYEVKEWNGKKGIVEQLRGVFTSEEYDHILDVPIVLL